MNLAQDLTAERTVLGGLMLDPSAWPDVEWLVKADFYADNHRNLYQLMHDMRACGDPVDMLAVCSQLTRLRPDEIEGCGGVRYVSSLSDHVATTEGLGFYAQIIQEAARRRRLVLGLSELMGAAQDPSSDVDAVLARCGTLAASDASSRADTWTGAPELALDAARAWEARIVAARSGVVVGIQTGMPELDGLLNPALPGKVTVLAGRPAMGKSAMALNLALRAALDGYHVGIVSLEMAKDEVTDRLCIPMARVDAGAVLRGQMTDQELDRMMQAADRLSRLPLWIDDEAGQTDADVRRRVRALHKAHGLDLVVVDYMQLMESADEGRNSSREAIVSAASRRTKALARELEIHVISLSQINRGVEARSDKRPSLGDLRESGAIEQDADRVVFLYRDDYYNQDSPDRGRCEVIVAKQRAGQTGTAKVAWSGALQRFGEDRWR